MGLPKWKCHKIVQAAKIVEIKDSGGVLVLEGCGEMDVGPQWLNRHNPEVGGYYVRYRDDFSSYSPRQAFEEGYTPIG